MAVDATTGLVVGVAEWERWSAGGSQKRVLRPGVGGAWGAYLSLGRKGVFSSDASRLVMLTLAAPPPPGLRSKSLALQARISALLWPDRSADPLRANVLAETFPLVAHVWGGERAETWFLELLCVRLEVQGRGFGRE